MRFITRIGQDLVNFSGGFTLTSDINFRKLEYQMVCGNKVNQYSQLSFFGV